MLGQVTHFVAETVKSVSALAYNRINIAQPLF